MKPGTCVWKACVWSACAVATVLVGIAGEAGAQDYPSRAITVVVPFPPGGASDVVARIVTNQMSKILGQSIIIENVSGAGGRLPHPTAIPCLPRPWARMSQRRC